MSSQFKVGKIVAKLMLQHLVSYRDFVFNLSFSFNSRTRLELGADATCVDLRSRSPYFYEFGCKIAPLWVFPYSFSCCICKFTNLMCFLGVLMLNNILEVNMPLSVRSWGWDRMHVKNSHYYQIYIALGMDNVFHW